MNSKEAVNVIVEALEGKKARATQVISVEELTSLADYFVICSGTSNTHMKTLVDEVQEKMKEKGQLHKRLEGYNSAKWILLDYGDVVVHVMSEDDRDFYNLERLWTEGVRPLRE